jgi:cobalt transporter subunit CbtA
MINRLVTVSLLAGLCAGLFVALLQHFSATPLILNAEIYENAGKSARLVADPLLIPVHGHQPASPSGALATGDGAPEHDHAGWKPEDGIQRTAFTTLVTVATAIGFAFLLAGAMLGLGDAISRNSALIYAGIFFFAFGLAPAAGLAPELPGSAGAALGARQIWWIGTVLASLAGAWLVLKGRSGGAAVLGFLLLLAPHLIGAPHPHALESRVPAELAARFTALSIFLQGALWLSVGYAVGGFWRWREDRADA